MPLPPLAAFIIVAAATVVAFVLRALGLRRLLFPLVGLAVVVLTLSIWGLMAHPPTAYFGHVRPGPVVKPGPVTPPGAVTSP